MSIILLRDKSYCPNCRRKSEPQHFRECRACGMMIFLRPINFQKYEDDGAKRDYWAWINDRIGWVYRDWVVEKSVNWEKPLTPEVETAKLPENYGKDMTPDDVVKRGGKLKIQS